MKKLPVYLLLTLLSGCGNSSSSQKANSELDSISKRLVETKYINSDEISCNYINGEKDYEVKSLTSDVVSGILQTKFDVIIPYEMTKEVVVELKQSINENGKFSANSFWSKLTHSTKKALNDYLIEKFGRLSDKDFNLKRKLIAYAFTVYTELEQINKNKKDFKPAVRLKTDHHNRFEEFIVAFSYDIRDIIDLEICNIHELENIKTPNELIMPSDIVSNVDCKNLEGSKVTFTIQTNKKLYVKVNGINYSDNIEVDIDKIKTSENKYVKRMSYEDSEVEIDVKIFKKRRNNAYYDSSTGSFIYDTIKYLNINIEKRDHSKLKYNRMDCRAIKPFVI